MSQNYYTESDLIDAISIALTVGRSDSKESFKQLTKNILSNFKKPINEQKEEEIKLVGTLTKPFGIQHYLTSAKVGENVFENNDRYFIILTNMNNKPERVSFYKNTLKPYINFF